MEVHMSLGDLVSKNRVAISDIPLDLSMKLKSFKPKFSTQHAYEGKLDNAGTVYVRMYCPVAPTAPITVSTVKDATGWSTRNGGSQSVIEMRIEETDTLITLWAPTKADIESLTVTV
jgi:hypothetical protein